MIMEKNNEIIKDANFIVEDIESAVIDLLDYHNGKKDSEVLHNLIETYVKCNKYIIK